jgi:hypothetical protein
MARLAEHIASIESEMAVMTHDGHHTDPQICEAMKKIDTAVWMLNRRKRELEQLNQDKHDI